MRTSLPLRISLISLLFAAAVALALTTLGGAFLYQQQQDNAGLHAQQLSNDLADSAERLVALGLRVEDFVGFEEQCATLIRNNPQIREAALLDRDGRLLYHSGEGFTGWPHEVRRPLSHSVWVVTSAANRIAISPVQQAGTPLPQGYALTLVDETTQLAATLRRVGWLLVCALTLFGIGLGIQQYIFWRTVGHPLASLIRTADSIQPDDLASMPTFSIQQRDDDFGRLNQAFAHLVQRLQDARRALLAQNEQLEAAVQERTAELERVNQELAKDIDRRRQLEQELRQMANTDALTGLANRTFMLPYLARQLEQAKRDGALHGLILFDFNGFKAINDQHGHAAGDLALQEMARRLQRACRQNDVLARLGGDEFLVGFPAVSAAHAEVLARRLMAQFDAPLNVEGVAIPLHLGASLGIALYPQDGDSLETLMVAADAAMYAAKADGGGLRFAAPHS